MNNQLAEAVILLALTFGTVLYGAIVSKRVHDRRLQERIRDSIHLYAVVRSMLAERRQAI